MQEVRNHLAGAKSLYLRQHANNPVEWYPWSNTAIDKARQENKPILLSIGYSACHWCHIMADESFENQEIAALMNRFFINIKVDREERPDLDKIYQASYQLLMQKPGGWPLTLFLNPNDLTPFFAGTYFPPEARQGLPSFSDILYKVAEFYEHNKDVIILQNSILQKALEELLQPENIAVDMVLNPNISYFARTLLIDSFDPLYGGFGSAPKFPQPSLVYFLQYYKLAKLPRDHIDKEINRILDLTLTNMAEGGLFDHLGGGFFRYTVDAAWQIPHFEKMLYDNGQLLSLYAIANYTNIVQMTAEWLQREMQSPQGAFYSSIDADSEGSEGNFYCWRKDEIEELLTADEYRVFSSYFGINQTPNFEDKWHLTIKKLLMPMDKSALLSAQKKLFLAREKRPHPSRDEKIIIAWNGLVIKGMALAGRLLNKPEYINSAQHAIDDIREHYWNHKENRFLNAFLDDYAFLLDGLLEVLQSEWRTIDLEFAIALAEALLTHFYDQQNGGFYFTSHDHEIVIQRPKSLIDEALPSGNGIAAYGLTRLGFLLGESRYLSASENTLKIAWNSIQELPHLHTSLLIALESNLSPPTIVILRGKKHKLEEWQSNFQTQYHPQQLIFAIPEAVDDLPPLLALKRSHQDICAYYCKGMECSDRIDDLQALVEKLEG